MKKVGIFFIWKYINSSRKEWLRFDSLFMILGIVIAVAVLTVALAIFDGYQKTLKQVILGVNSHIYVFKPGESNIDSSHVQQLEEFFQAQPEVCSISRLIVTEAMVTAGGRVKGAVLRGIEWDQEMPATDYRKYVRTGSFQLENPEDIVIGYRLADILGVGIGDTVQVINPLNAEFTPLGMRPRSDNFRIIGLYHSGMYDYDSKFLFLNLPAAARFVSLQDEITMLEIRLQLEHIDRADYLAYVWETLLNDPSYDYQIRSWVDFNGNLFTLLELQKWVVFIILSFLVVVASFNVISSVSAAILERKRDIGILKAYGAGNALLRQLFLGRILIMGVISVIAGLLAGILFARFLSWQAFFLIKADVYFLEKINVSFPLESILVLLGVSMTIISLSALLPLRQISRLQVTEILRNE